MNPEIRSTFVADDEYPSRRDSAAERLTDSNTTSVGLVDGEGSGAANRPGVPLHQSRLDQLNQNVFLQPDGQNLNLVANQILTAIKSIVNRHGSLPPSLKSISILSGPLSQLVKSAEIPQSGTAGELILNEIGAATAGALNASNPYMVKNIIPNAAVPALAASLAASLLMANGVTGEDAGAMLNSEPACAAALARLAGLDPLRAGGVFTFGGTATNMYAVKIGLSKCSPDHQLKGVPGNVFLVDSVASHYSHETAANWLGLGYDRCLKVPTNHDQTTRMDILERTCSEVLSDGNRIAAIILSGGTTSNCAIDSISEGQQIRDDLVARFSLDYIPHLHVDSVIGWAFLNFSGYDVECNHLQFSDLALQQIAVLKDRTGEFMDADSFGVDFHKTGYLPYTSSMFVVRNQSDLLLLQRGKDLTAPLFHDDRAYNPGRFTLETSRSAASMLSTWIGLQVIGQEGYQVLLGHALEMGHIIRREVEKSGSEGLAIVNKVAYGPDVFVRCYPGTTIGDERFCAEMGDSSQMKLNDEYLSDLYLWLAKHTPDTPDGMHISKSAAAFYREGRHPVSALRLFPLNPFITEETSVELVQRLIRAKRAFDYERNHSQT
jgi:L-2,4-diaminobutyrate decarboxylase